MSDYFREKVITSANIDYKVKKKENVGFKKFWTDVIGHMIIVLFCKLINFTLLKCCIWPPVGVRQRFLRCRNGSWECSTKTSFDRHLGKELGTVSRNIFITLSLTQN